MIPRLCCLLLALLALPAGADYRQVVISEFGGPEMLRLVTRDTLPVPGPGEVRLRVLTASASFTDVMVRKGLYPEVSQEPPFPPGYDEFWLADDYTTKARAIQPDTSEINSGVFIQSTEPPIVAGSAQATPPAPAAASLSTTVLKRNVPLEAARLTPPNALVALPFCTMKVFSTAVLPPASMPPSAC